jgi:futalosine hydrolase
MILVVCALLPELRYFKQRPDVEVFACGVGPVEAALGTARKLALGPYEFVVNAGIAGAFRPHARIGEAVLVALETLADLGLEGGAPLELPGGATLIERERAHAGLLARCADCGLPTATGITVSQVTTTAATAQRLVRRYGAHIESMEGFSVLRAAAVAQVPALEVRGISNYVGDRDQSEWDFAAGARATAVALDAVLDRLTP